MTNMERRPDENKIHIFTDSNDDDESDNIRLCNVLKRINRLLVYTFYKFGYQVGLRPLYFIVVPIILSLALSTGLFFTEYEENPMKLFVPYNAPFRKEQKIVESHFPMNYSHHYDPVRFTRHEGHSRIIISAKDDKSIFRSFLWPEIMDMDARIRNISVNVGGEDLNYSELCAKWNGKCIENSALNINEIVGEIENGSTTINYPVMIVPFIVPQLLGGVVINETESRIMDAKAILIAYFLNIESDDKIEIAFEWETKLLKFLHGMDYDHIHASYYASRSLGDELKVKMDSCIPYIPLTGFIMVSACMGLLWMSDCVRSKPYIGLIGIISSVMSTGAAFGFLIYCNTTYTRLNVVALFLVLGIGVDDIFVAISAWQKTSSKDSVPERLAQTYSDAAVSVTITSITNALAFGVGTSTPALIVQAFCLYSCVTIIFAYVWFVTFCGGFLALSGYMEEQGRHALLIVKVKEAPEGSSSLTKRFYSLFCSSASHGKNTAVKEEKHVHVVSAFFRDYVGSLLCNGYFKVVVLLSLIGYLAGAIYGLTVLREGLYRHRMSRDDSYLVDFSLKDDAYFRHMPYSIQVVITGNLTYSDPETQKKLAELEKSFEQLPYGSDPIFTQSWLRSFLKRLRRKKDWSAEITDEASFIRVLREKYLQNQSNQLKLDIEFNEDYTRILASRMIFQAANVKDVYDDVVMMNAYRRVGEESEFNVTCFHLLFSLFDQHSMIKPLAIQSILIAVVLVVVVALLFIPDARGSCAIAFSILSIATGVIGYMAFWNINLDHVSAGSIFMCIGFSVDFSAHITYTYLSSKEKTSEGKIRDSMESLGLPIIQGGFTTVLSLVSFLLIPGYGYRTFFKTIFLVTIFAAYHSIILIPLFLSQLQDMDILFKERKPKNIPEPRASLRRTNNGSLKLDSNENTKRLNGSVKSVERANTETELSHKEENKKEDLNPTLANGQTLKLEADSDTNEGSEGNGVANEGFTSDETN